MSLTPHQSGVRSCEVQSPDIFSDVRRNLDGQFLNARDSIQAENMCVYARVRPMLPDETAKGYKECIAAIDEKTIRTVVPVSSLKHKNSRQSEEIDFSFSSAFGPETGQFVFFLETMLPTLQNFVEGGNGLIFSYGITGSGKTYTLQGNSENPGIIPLSLRLYFAAVEKQLLEGIKVKPHMYNNIIALSPAEQKEEYRIKQQLLALYDDECEIAPGSFRNSHSKTFAMTLCDLFSDSYKAEERQTTLNPEEMESAQAATVMKEVIQKSAESQYGICNIWVSFVEIYNESIFDLLTPVTNERKRLMLRECSGNVYIEGAREICISNGDEALKILNIGRKNLSIASTKMNYQSSRSHCIYTIRVVRVRDANDLSYGKVNRLSFCDLAGSERTAKAQTTGIRLKEASSINTSLLVLGRCLEQLRMNQTGRDKRIIPFRDSKLTRLFSGFFMGQGKAVMIANASPCDYTFDETSHVLKFSALARKLKVNDTFYSEATSTLQSICNEWSNMSSRSLCNESSDSIDSDSELLQQKDEIIEKLLALAERLTKKEQENADLEMKIRREVCREYSEYSDQLLEDKRIMYEEQMETMREIFKKRIAKRDKMYEKIIEDYEQRLNETSDSNENTFSHSRSILDLDDSGELSPEKILDEKNDDKSEKSQSSKLKELESSVESLTYELEKLKEELCESQKSVGNLEKELKICREEKEILSSECANYKNVASKSTEDVKKYEADIKDLEEQLFILKRELNTTKELNQSKEFNLKEMESDNDTLKAEVKTLKKDNHALKDVIETYEANMEEYKTKIRALEDEVLCYEKNYISIKEKLQIHMNSVSEMKNENGELKSALETLTEQINQFEEESKKYISSTKDYEGKIHNLEDKLTSNEKHFEKQLQEKLDLTSQLKKDIDNINIENEKMICQIKELKQSKVQDEEIIANYKAKIHTLEEKLLSANQSYVKTAEELQNHSKDVSELEKEIDKYKSEIRILETKFSETTEKLKKTLQKNESKDQNFEEMISSLQEKLKIAEEELKKIFLHSTELLSELEVDDCQGKATTKVQKSYEHLSDSHKLYLSVTKILKEKVSSLQQDFLIANKNADLIKKEMKVRETVSAELEKEIDVYKHEIEALKEKMLEKNELEEKFMSLNQELETVKDINKQISSKLNCIEVSKNSEEADKKAKDMLSEKLKEELTSVQKKLNAAINDIQEKNSKIAELENEIDMYKQNIEALKENVFEKDELKKKFISLNEELKTVKDVNKQISSKLNDIEMSRNSEEGDKKTRDMLYEKLEEELTSVQKKLNAAVNDIQEKNSKIAELENVKKTYESEIQKLKQNQQITEAELTEKLSFMDRELKNSKDEAQELSSKLCEIQNEKSAYELEIQQLKQNQIVVSEQTEKLHLVDKELKSAKEKIQILSSKICELERCKSTSELGTQTLEQNEQIVELELKEKLQLVGKELKTANEEVQKLSSKIYELEKVNTTYELDNKELNKVQKILKQQLEEKLNPAHTEVQHLSSELLKTKSTSEFGTQTLKQTEQIVEIEITEKLQSVDEELKTANEEVQKLSLKICELEKEKCAYESEIKKLKQNQQILETELTGKLHLADKDFKDANEEIQKLSSKICELEKEKSAYDSEMDKLKLQEEQNISLNEKLLFVTKELETANEDNHQKSSKLHELQNSINMLKSDIEKIQEEKENLISEKIALQEKLVGIEREIEILKQDDHQKSSNEQKTESAINALKLEIEKVEGEKQNLISEKRALQEKLVEIEREVEILKQDVQQKSTNELKIENEMCVYKDEINKLKENNANLLSEKLKFENDVNCYKEKVEKLQKNASHVNQNKLKELEREITVYKLDIKKMKDNQELSEKEKEDLMMVLSTNNEKIDDLEEKLTALTEDLNAANEDIFTKATTIEDLKNRLAQLCTLLELVEKCETRASDKIKALQNAIETYKSQELHLHNQIKNKENSVEELEKAVLDLQEQVKNVQRSCDNKLVSELEQHETEIVQTIKLKNIVAEENMSLKKQKLNSKQKPPDVKKAGNTTDAVPKKNVNNKGKENIPKISTSRTLRKKEVDLKEISFSSIEECSTPIVHRVKSRKRVSEEDFEPSNTKASKKMKSTEATKIPTRRPSRKKLNDKTEAMSPIQKIANSITSKVKGLSSNIPHISSPRLTRGRKKLFNLEAPTSSSSSGSQRVTKGTK